MIYTQSRNWRGAVINIYQKLIFTVAGAAIGFLTIKAIPTQAAILINSQSAVVNPGTHEAVFTIEFNEAPDFFSADSFGRQANSFQYFIDADGGLPVFRGSPYYSELETIIRGEEIHFAGDILIRNVFPIDSGEPNSGGWGASRGSVPYTLSDTVLTFSTPLSLIGDDDGQFSYRLEAYDFGAWNGQAIEDKSAVVPEPSSVFGLGIFSLSLLSFKKKRASHSEKF